MNDAHRNMMQRGTKDRGFNVTVC